MSVAASTRAIGMVVALAAVLAGCHTAPTAPDGSDDATHRAGSVSYAMLPAYASDQFKLKHSEHAFGAQPIAHDAPVYPASSIAKAPPSTTIRVKAVVGDHGMVSEVRDLDVSSDPTHLAFFKACEEAVMHWTFSPMTVVEEFDDGHGNISQKRKTAAFSLDYAFRFDMVEGRPSVTTGP